LAAIGAFARLAFDASVFVRVCTTDTAGAAMSEDLTGREKARRHQGEDDFHIKIILDPKTRRSSGFLSAR